MLYFDHPLSVILIALRINVILREMYEIDNAILQHYWFWCYTGWIISFLISVIKKSKFLPVMILDAVYNQLFKIYDVQKDNAFIK